MDLFFKIVTEFGGVFAVLAVGIFVFFALGLREAFRFGTVIGIAVALGWILKQIFAFPRPDAAKALVKASGYSFPSLHTLSVVVLTLYLFFAFIRFGRLHISLKIVSAIGLIIIAALVGWSRVYLGVHFLEDVLAGAVIGADFYFFLTILFDKIFKLRLKYKFKSEKDTKRFAYEFARSLRNRKKAIILFTAPMGAGKTTFVRQVAKYLGVRSVVTSPTFPIINKYSENVFHIDLYRLESAEELENTDFYEIIDGENFVFIEWSEKFKIDYPKNAIKISIEIGEGNIRVFNIAY